VTAGNSSQISDGAAALLVTTVGAARELAGARWPGARVRTGRRRPDHHADRPDPGDGRALERAGLGLDDIGAFEVNEAFASVIGAWLAETGADSERVNPTAAPSPSGHPLGGVGRPAHDHAGAPPARRGLRYGLQTMCEGGGMANATVLERL
jgi:acetyl-CoA acyltransferase